MPAGSDLALPQTFRPFGVRIAIYVAGVLLVLVVVVTWLAFPKDIQEQFTYFQRATVIGHTLWVTPNSPDERWPAGEFVNQSSKDTGLAEWTKADRNIENTDVVLWYVFGIHHITRPEDWPVMPVDVVGFRLTAAGFFDANPALDVAPGT